MTPNLITLEEHQRRKEAYAALLEQRWHKTGIACPQCESELLRDTKTMMAFPHVQPAKCSADCGWTGYL